jgi:glycosyltransferase involved in cell wall biosynthesis
MYSIAKKAKLILTPSNQSKKDLIGLVKIPEEKIFVIPWGVDLKKFRPTKTKRNRKIVGYIGGLGKRKNVEWILYLAKEFKDFEFKIAGKGAELNKLIRIKKKLKLNNVKFIGFVPEENLIEFYNSITIFIFPSLEEGFGIPLVEAMACEVPYIIGTNTGIGKILPIYKFSNFRELKNVLDKIKKSKIRPLKNQRRWLIKNNLTWKGHVTQLIEIYEKF